MKTKVYHTLGPCYNSESKILILGSFPSVISREVNFYYGNKQNRFWKMLEAIYGYSCGNTIEEKKSFILKNHLALWDVIESCKIDGSKDSSIEDIKINDINSLVKLANIKAIILNGNKAFELYKKYIDIPNIEYYHLPSTSPANARSSFTDLVNEYSSYLKRNF